MDLQSSMNLAFLNLRHIRGIFLVVVTGHDVLLRIGTLAVAHVLFVFF